MTFKLRNNRCSGCAFTKGTEANNHAITQIKATFCSEIPEPFFCHFNSKDGRTLPEGQHFLCEGWREKTWELDDEGYYKNQPEWQKELKKQLLAVVEAFQDRGDATDEEIIEAIRRAHENLEVKISVKKEIL